MTRMWCEKCLTDVAAHASLDNQRLYCTVCGSELLAVPSAPPPNAPPVSTPPARRDPRELLARWAKEDALDPFSSLLKGSGDELPKALQRGAAKPQPEKRADQKLRMDHPHDFGHSRTAAAPPVAEEPPAAPAPPQPAVQPAPAQVVYVQPAPAQPPVAPAIPIEHYLHAAHRLPPPHFDVTTVPQPPEKSAKWVALAGQLFAYLGVGTLTLGAVLVLVGYFGGPANYAPTGWLVTTAGQMLLFLGVVTLISGGMEQTTQEVTRKIDTLGDKLVRIEHATGVRPPHFAAQPSSSETAQQLRDQIAHLTRQLDQLQ